MTPQHFMNHCMQIVLRLGAELRHKVMDSLARELADVGISMLDLGLDS
jgi:hypothetical protein